MRLEAVLDLVRGHQGRVCNIGICWRRYLRSSSQRELRSSQTVLMRQCWRRPQDGGLSRRKRISFWMTSDCVLCLAVHTPTGLRSELWEALFVFLRVYFYSFKLCAWYVPACGYVHVSTGARERPWTSRAGVTGTWEPLMQMLGTGKSSFSRAPLHDFDHQVRF